MNVMEYIRQLEAAGFSEEVLDRAIASAGASRMAYLTLLQSVAERGMTPTEALRALEGSTPPAIS